MTKVSMVVFLFRSRRLDMQRDLSVPFETEFDEDLSYNSQIKFLAQVRVAMAFGPPPILQMIHLKC